MSKFRKKPVVIEAFQMTKEGYHERYRWPEWLMAAYTAGETRFAREQDLGAAWDVIDRNMCLRFMVGTLTGPRKVAWGDYIIRGAYSDLVPCKPDIFEATYEPVEG